MVEFINILLVCITVCEALKASPWLNELFYTKAQQRISVHFHVFLDSDSSWKDSKSLTQEMSDFLCRQGRGEEINLLVPYPDLTRISLVKNKFCS